MYFVYNRYRPLIAEPEDAYALMRDIERVSGLRFDGIINNSNLGNETSVKTVTDSVGCAERLAEISGLPLVLTTALAELNIESAVPINDITKKLF